MKRFCLISSAAAVSLLALAPVANAEPAVLYIPTEAIDLFPSGDTTTECGTVGLNDYNPGLGCVPGLEMMSTEDPYADAEMLTTGIQTAFDAFDLHITNERPPAYLPHYMLLPSDMASAEGTSYSCSGSPLYCGGRGRNGIAFTSGATMNCMDPDQLEVSLYAVGRMVGLEGSTNPMDPMFYPPDFAMVATAFQDECSDIAPRIDPKTMMPVPLECTSADHNGDCDPMQQNTVADLTAYFGARVEDADPPELTMSMPADGDDFPLEAGEGVVSVTFSVAVADADPIVGLGWRVESDVFMADLGRNYITACTNNHCDYYLTDGDPFKPTDSEWTFDATLPGGDYTVTLEASDYHGNAAAPITFAFTVNGGMSSEESGSDTDMPMTSGATMTTAPSTSMTGFLEGSESDSGETGDEGDTSPEDMDDGGCNCTSSSGAGGAFMLILGLFGFAATRRRD